ncbi:MAG: hypothetical protein J0I09_07475 [Sphingobacteriia bacterium]|nr:hypothetical protein [Sphingobacteriia bacterium]
MKNRSLILFNIAEKRFLRRLKSKEKQRRRRRRRYLRYITAKASLNGDTSLENVIASWLPINISYLLNCEESDFHISKITKNIPENNGVFKVPKEFSIVENAKESYEFIRTVVGALITQKYIKVSIDYSECIRLDLGAQVFFDIILKDIIKFFKKCKQYKHTRSKVRQIDGVHYNNNDVRKLLFSVGSPVIHSKQFINFSDIIPYKLCIHDRELYGEDSIKIREQKDIDTTKLVDYVIDSLKRLNKTLTPEKIDDLSTVIGEILINAEEHSTTKHRFSIGYFHERYEGGKHFGVFRLAILNFGKTIYEKFKDPECPNKDEVKKMQSLSEKYTTKRFFFSKTFEEETLWTLYALQDGVTSVATDRYKRRGNGSIQFIESFFNIKGKGKEIDDFSILAILSGKTSITFDGTYSISHGYVDDEPYKFMTFNDSCNIEDKPDTKFVKFVDNYFPGTIISARIMFNEDDLTDE